MEWIKNLQVGDQVIVNHCDFEGRKSICTVEKITPAGFIKVNGALYKQNGEMRGGDAWCTPEIREATPDAIRSIKQNNVVKKAFRRMRETTKLSYNQAVEILKILELPTGQ